MSEGAARLEALTKQLADRLWVAARQYRPTRRERHQDWLMGQLARDPALKSRLLRFLDVVAALDFDRRGILVKRLFQEYLGGAFPGSSMRLRARFLLYRQPFMPARLVAGMSRSMLQTIANRFVVGHDLASVHNAIAYLDRYGRYPTFSLLGEDVLSEYEADLFKTRLLELIDSLGRHPWSGRTTAAGSPALQLSIKLSSLTQNFNPADPEGTLDRVRRRLEDVARRCAAGKIGLTIDAEQYEHRELTWHIFREVFGPGSSLEHWDDVGLTVQSYFTDSEEYLRTVLRLAGQRRAPFQIRLAKGAYWEYEVIVARNNGWPVPVFERKQETDRAFRCMLGMLLEHRKVTTAVASHNIEDHAYAEALRELQGLPLGAIEHQTLFLTAEGVSRAMQRLGWQTRDYVPSGELVPSMAYLVRRIQENTSTEGFLSRSRTGEGVAALRLPPEIIEEAATSSQGSEAASGFHNSPPKRLFLSRERLPFESALRDATAQWGQEYLLQQGGQSVKTQEIKPSLSPSRPDASRPVGLVHMGGVREAEQSMRLARQGFARWSATPPEERARILTGAAALLAKERDNLAAWIVHEGGRTWGEALADVDESVDHLAYNAGRLTALQDTVGKHYRPRGVVVVISPWNFPAALPAGMLSGALAAGNSVILKSAEQTPIIAARMVEILHAAGIPQDALVHLPGWGEVAGAHLVSSPEVDMVAFTGSKAAGLAIARQASAVRLPSAVKKVVAEMGGKNAIVVFPDADIDEAVRGILLSAFEHANQKCSACSRVFVHTAVLERLRQRLVRAVASLPVGPADAPGTLVNPLIEPEARERVLAYARKAQQEGKVLADLIEQPTGNPLQVGPMVVELDPAGVPKSTTAQEEIFGPILALVPFHDEAKMLAQVNGTVYALTAGVYSRSPATIARITRRIRAGNIYVNRKITGARVGVEPFGGFRLSGTGPKAGGADYLFAFLTRRSGYRTERPPLPATPESYPRLDDKMTPWAVNAALRRDVLARCVRMLMGSSRGDLARAVSDSYGLSRSEADRAAGQVATAAFAVVDAAHEIAEREPTLAVPGQRNYIDWQTPRGNGFVATGDSTDAALFAGMVFGPLLAGNGLVLAPADRLRHLSAVLAACLHRAGVPRTALVEAPRGGPEAAVCLAAQMFHFAVTDMSLELTGLVYERLGDTREAEGQTWVKALVSMAEGPQPGEPGFVRLFALPKTIAIRTLRHSADLDIPEVEG